MGSKLWNKHVIVQENRTNLTASPASLCQGFTLLDELVPRHSGAGMADVVFQNNGITVQVTEATIHNLAPYTSSTVIFSFKFFVQADFFLFRIHCLHGPFQLLPLLGLPKVVGAGERLVCVKKPNYKPTTHARSSASFMMRAIMGCRATRSA